MHPSTEDIFCVTQNVLNTMVSMNAELLESTGPAASGTPLTGCVQISGQWQGAVVVNASEKFVRQAATKMLMIASSDVAEADLQDVLAELTNMIGGNIKGLVPGPSYLSIPSVTIGEDFRFHLRNTRVVSETAMVSENEALKVLICESTE